MQRYGFDIRDLGDRGVATGSVALDAILQGGFARDHLHLIEGRPGSGKTTLALQFLQAGRDAGERGLYITLSEGVAELSETARTHGFSLDGIDFCELVPPEMSLDPALEQSVVYASDLELGETVTLVMDAVRRHAPRRVVFDSMSEIRLLAQNALRFRRQVLALKHFFAQAGCTVVALDDLTSEDDDVNLHSLAHGVIRLEQLASGYGSDRRRLRVLKMRARPFIGGYHDYLIATGGLKIFPRMIAAHHLRAESHAGKARSGLAPLDEMLNGGLDWGTSTLIMGPSGIGKSTLSMRFAQTAIDRGERVLYVTFDESIRNLKRRCRGLSFDLDEPEAAGLLQLRAIDPAELTPGELIDYIREQVADGVSAVILDSLSGFYHAMHEEHHLLLQIHELLSYLNAQNVLTFVTLAQSGMVGALEVPFDLTYLADTVLLLRFFEAQGEMRRALAVVKQRTDGHEMTLREMRIEPAGITVGPVLRHFQGILTGVPVIVEGPAAA